MFFKDIKNAYNQRIDKLGVFKFMNKIVNLKSKRCSNVSINVNLINDYFISITTPNYDYSLITFDCVDTKMHLLHFKLQLISKYDLIQAWRTIKYKNSCTTDILGICSFIIE